MGTRPRPGFGTLLELADGNGGLPDPDHADPDEVREDPTAHITGRPADPDAYSPPRMRTIGHAPARAIAERLAASAGEAGVPGGRPVSVGVGKVNAVVYAVLDGRPVAVTGSGSASVRTACSWRASTWT